MTSSICIRYEIYPPIGMRGLWNSKALSSNEIFDCRLIHTQGESWDCSYSGRESWDCKSQPFQRQSILTRWCFIFASKQGQVAQWIENDKTYHNDMIGPQKDTLDLICAKAHLVNEWLWRLNSPMAEEDHSPHIYSISSYPCHQHPNVSNKLYHFSKNRNSQNQGLNAHCRLW